MRRRRLSKLGLGDQDAHHEPAQGKQEWSSGNPVRDYEHDHGDGKYGDPDKEADHDGSQESIVPFPPTAEQKMQRELSDQHHKSGGDNGGPGVAAQN